MATRIFAVNPGGTLYNAVETVGPTATSAIVAVVVDLAANITDGATTRGPNKQEVLKALETLKLRILETNWPPA